MKKLLLLSVILIVGCAPTKPPMATFYIGMSEEEFIKKNNIDIAATIMGKETNKSVDYVKVNANIFPQDSISAVYSEFHNRFSPYYFEFRNDTLAQVSDGFFNYINYKHIDYDKYATPPK